MSFSVRPATVEDVPDLVALRRVLFEAMGTEDEGALDRMCTASARYFEERIPPGLFRAWVAEEVGRPIGAIGLEIHRVPPSPCRLEGTKAYIMNLVTLPTYRRRGVATALLERVLETVEAEGIPLASLHATRDGRGIYHRAGFAVDEALPEMRRTMLEADGT